MNLEELRNLSVDELANKLGASKRELLNLRMQAAAGKLEKTHQMRIVRREVAQLMTLLKERGSEPQPAVSAKATREPQASVKTKKG